MANKPVENIRLANLSPLPTRTWTWLGVNGGEEDVQLAAGSPLARPALIGAEQPGLTATQGTGVAEGLASEAAAGELGTDFAAFVTARAGTRVRIETKEGQAPAVPVVVRESLGEDAPAAVNEIGITARKGSRLTVVLQTDSVSGAKLHALFTHVTVEPGAELTLVLTQLLDGGCLHFSDIAADVQKDGKFSVVQLELGGSRAYAGCRAVLGDAAALDIATAYLGDQDRRLDIGYIAEQYGAKSQSNISVHGALLDRSSKIFRGTIDFKKGARAAKGREEEFNVLLSPNVRNRTAPLILCAEEDVDGQHAASTGRISEEKLFYLMSRGLDLNAAKRLVVEAAFAPVTEKIPLPQLRETVNEYIGGRIQTNEK